MVLENSCFAVAAGAGTPGSTGLASPPGRGAGAAVVVTSAGTGAGAVAGLTGGVTAADGAAAAGTGTFGAGAAALSTFEAGQPTNTATSTAATAAAAAPPAHHNRRHPSSGTAAESGISGTALACGTTTVEPPWDSIWLICTRDLSRKSASAWRISSADWKRSVGAFDIARETIDSISGSMRLMSVFIGSAGCWITFRMIDEILLLSGSNGRRPDNIS